MRPPFLADLAARVELATEDSRRLRATTQALIAVRGQELARSSVLLVGLTDAQQRAVVTPDRARGAQRRARGLR